MPIILSEDEGKKLGKKRISIPKYVMDKLKEKALLYSDGKYKDHEGHKRLMGMLKNNPIMTFAQAKRMDFDIRHMDQSSGNTEYDMTGGDTIRDWLHSALGALRNSVREVEAVPQVKKLSTKDIKPKDIQQTVKIGSSEIKLEGTEFNGRIRRIF